MRIYLSGPMTGLPDHNFPAFNAEAARLRALGWEVSNPAENDHLGKPWEECLKTDIKQLMDCDMLALLPGWMDSRGANLEVHLAHRVKIKIVMSSDINEEPYYWSKEL